ncbi:MAG: hypothetical protein IT369_02380 [Candidatus Latescibacteria bacterium]|nr:hypothetical protein [Candidatus Latescibacterota bacterium]
MAAKRKGKQRRKSSWWRHLLGLFGLGCVAWSAVGLLSSREPATLVAEYPASPPSRHQAPPAEVEHQITDDKPAPGAASGLPYYPLEVGRYWVYEGADPKNGVQVKIERRIERREQRSGQDLYFFSDGSLAYLEQGKVFEFGAEGGVNVIPMEHGSAPYVYQNQGLRIEKQVGAADTTVVVGGRSYAGCLEVITHLHYPDRPGQFSYSSYYAKGVGLVGQERWPRQEHAVLSMVLQDYGVQPL